MAELLSPGVFIEEVPSAIQTIQGVSTSNMGIAGFSPKGPTDVATLVTSFDQYVRTFGGFTRNSFMPASVAAFFANGGRRAYVVRVMPSDAVAAQVKIQSQQTDQALGETADSTATTFSKSDAASVLRDNNGASPLVASSISLRYRGVGTLSTTVNTKQRNGTTNLTGDGALLKFEGRLDPASFPAGIFDANLNPTDPALSLVAAGGVDVTIIATIAAAPVNLVFSGAAPGPVVTATSGGHSGTFDRRTGFFSITYGTAPDNATNITATYTKTTTTKTITDNGLGALTGAGIIDGAYAATVNGIGPNAVNYAGGGYNFKVLAGQEPVAGSPILATYKINAWTMNPVSKGAWGNDLQVTIRGSADFFVAASNSYTRFDVDIALYSTEQAAFLVQETYSQLSFSDPTSPFYFADVINGLSTLVTVVTPSGDEAPKTLSGIQRSRVIAGGADAAAGQVLTTNLHNSPVAKRTVSIAYTGSSGTARTITDNGSGSLIGDIDATYTATVVVGGVSVGPNQIDYTTGAINVKTVETIQDNTLVTASFYSQAAATSASERFGDTAKGYTAGSDGTFTSVTYSRNQFTVSTLGATNKGIFALNRVDEIMQVVLPDFAGDVTVTGDLLDFAEQRASLPSGGDRFIILTVPKGSSPQQAVDWFRFSLARYSKWAALYWPWIKIADPLQNGRPLVMPPMGHIAGVYARTDSNRNVGKAPAGTVDGQLQYHIGLEYISTQGERDLVYPNRINPLISTPQTGTAVWGVRTISSDLQWLYVNARRLFMFLEKSVYNSTQWIVFENNGPGLWGRISLQLSSFLLGLFNDGYFAGNTPKDAFFVKVDSSNNPPETINAGQVVVDVGAAPNKPAEFVRFRFQQKTIE